MKYRGEMKLMNGNKVIASSAYCNRENRQSIITAWQIEYAEFDLYNLQIVPTPYEERVEVPLIKMKQKRRKEPKEANPTPMIRPAAVYDNNKSLYNYGK